MNIPIEDAEELFEDLIRRAEAGEQVVVTRDGKPVVEITTSKDLSAEPSKFCSLPRGGALEGQIWIADDFNVLGPEWGEYIK